MPDGSDDRRVFERWPMRDWNVLYELLKTDVKATGAGKTINISAGGVLISTDSALPKGKPIRLTIDWPVRLNGVTALNLVLEGTLVRTGNDEAAISIKHYDLRPLDADTK